MPNESPTFVTSWLCTLFTSICCQFYFDQILSFTKLCLNYNISVSMRVVRIGTTQGQIGINWDKSDIYKDN